MMGARLKLEGKRFSRLLVLHSVEAKPRRKWLCQCDCGNTHIVESWLLTANLVRSCGCLHRETCSQNGKATATHNLSNNPEYSIQYREWNRLKRLCKKHGIALSESIASSFPTYLTTVGGAHSTKRLWAKAGSSFIDDSSFILLSPKERLQAIRRTIATGTSIKRGRIEITVGENKFRKLHSVLAEQHIINRKLSKNEVVHHIDGNPLNNDISNLQVMTRAEHASYHAKQFFMKRERNQRGQFI